MSEVLKEDIIKAYAKVLMMSVKIGGVVKKG